MNAEHPRTLVVIPPEREDELLDLARQWTAGWMIKSALWVRPSDLIPDEQFNPDAPPRVMATIIGRNGSASVELFEELGRQPYDLLRLIAVRSVEPGIAVNAELDKALDVLRLHLHDYSKPEGTELTFTNLIFSPTHQGGASANHLIEAGWNMNVVVSPENRPTPQSFDAFSRHSDPKKWAGFVLSHVVTAAGLWATVNASPYDDARVPESQTHVYLQRLSIRGVLTGSLVVNVALAAMDSVAKDVSPLADPLISVEEEDLRLMSPEEEEYAVQDLIRIALELEGGQLAYAPASGFQTPARNRIGFVRQMGELARFGWDKFVDSPRWVIRKIKSRTSRRTTAALHGADGDIEVDVAGILHWEDAAFADEIQNLNQRREAIRARFAEPIPALRFDVNANLWTSLREISFSLLDGSPMPAGARLSDRIAQSSTPSVVSSLGCLYPDWQSVWIPPIEVAQELAESKRLPKEPVSWLDISFSEAWLGELDRRINRLAERDQVLRQRLGATSAELTIATEELYERETEMETAEQEVAWCRDDLEEYLEERVWLVDSSGGEHDESGK